MQLLVPGVIIATQQGVAIPLYCLTANEPSLYVVERKDIRCREYFLSGSGFT
jgi:hypothetical protein